MYICFQITEFLLFRLLPRKIFYIFYQYICFLYGEDTSSDIFCFVFFYFQTLMALCIIIYSESGNLNENPACNFIVIVFYSFPTSVFML